MELLRHRGYYSEKILLFSILATALIFIFSGCSQDNVNITEPNASIDQATMLDGLGTIDQGMSIGENSSPADDLPEEVLSNIRCPITKNDMGGGFRLMKGSMECDIYLAIDLDSVFYNPEISLNLERISGCTFTINETLSQLPREEFRDFNFLLGETKELDICVIEVNETPSQDLETFEAVEAMQRTLSTDVATEPKRRYEIALAIALPKSSFERIISDYEDSDYIERYEEANRMVLAREYIALGQESYISELRSGRAFVSLPPEWNSEVPKATSLRALYIKKKYDNPNIFNQEENSLIYSTGISLGINAACIEMKIQIKDEDSEQYDRLARAVSVVSPANILSHFNLDELCSKR